MNPKQTTHNLSIEELHQDYLKGQVRVLEVVKEHLSLAHSLQPKYNMFITICDDEALRQAQLAQTMIDQGKATLLTGIPYTAKDVFCTKGVRTTAASNMLGDYIPPYDATVIALLKQAGAVLLGKTNCDSFGFGSSTENSDFGVTKNPWDIQRVAGGSSGGSGAVAAFGIGLFSIAEDTGGSIRTPAAFTGTTGLQVTYGRVSRYGSISYASSLDTVGVIARSALDAEGVLQAISGQDPLDAQTYQEPIAKKPPKMSLKNIKIGLPNEYYSEGLDSEIQSSIETMIEFFKSQGAKVQNVNLPHSEYAVPVYYIIACSEASSNLSRYHGTRYAHATKKAAADWDTFLRMSRSEGFNSEVKRRIMLGTFALSAGYYDAYYKKAAQVRRLIRDDFMKVFETVDVIVAPVMPMLPFTIGEKSQDPLAMYLADIYTVSTTLSGMCALAFPTGFSKSQLPIAAQFIGRPKYELELLWLVEQWQSASKWHLQEPERV